MRDLTAHSSTAAFIAAAALATLTPFATGARPAANATLVDQFPGWPTSFEGLPLTSLPMTEKEQLFGRDFPGRMGRFTDGRREIVIRYVTAATRKLHPATDCFRGIGYAIKPVPARRDALGHPMSCIDAHRGEDVLTVCETIRDEQGASWADVSSWYWSALFNSGGGPWWSFVVAQKNEGAAFTAAPSSK